MGYFTVNPYIKDGYYDVDFLAKQNCAYENEYIRHVIFEKPLIIKIDGKNNLGIVYKPEE